MIYIAEIFDGVFNIHKGSGRCFGVFESNSDETQVSRGLILYKPIELCRFNTYKEALQCQQDLIKEYWQ